MAIETPTLTLVASVDALADLVVEASDRLSRAAGDPTEIAAVVGLCDRIVGEADDLRTDLDALAPLTDVDDFNIADKIRLFGWQQATIVSLHRIRTGAHGCRVAARELLRGINPERQHVVISGDTLQRLAAKYLGDFTLWPKIAAKNGIKHGDPLGEGDVLVIPDAGE